MASQVIRALDYKASSCGFESRRDCLCAEPKHLYLIHGCFMYLSIYGRWPVKKSSSTLVPRHTRMLIPYTYKETVTIGVLYDAYIFIMY